MILRTRFRFLRVHDTSKAVPLLECPRCFERGTACFVHGAFENSTILCAHNPSRPVPRSGYSGHLDSDWYSKLADFEGVVILYA